MRRVRRHGRPGPGPGVARQQAPRVTAPGAAAVHIIMPSAGLGRSPAPWAGRGNTATAAAGTAVSRAAACSAAPKNGRGRRQPVARQLRATLARTTRRASSSNCAHRCIRHSNPHAGAGGVRRSSAARTVGRSLCTRRSTSQSRSRGPQRQQGERPWIRRYQRQRWRCFRSRPTALESALRQVSSIRHSNPHHACNA